MRIVAADGDRRTLLLAGAGNRGKETNQATMFASVTTLARRLPPYNEEAAVPPLFASTVLLM
jgi:hypothetical protein